MDQRPLLGGPQGAEWLVLAAIYGAVIVAVVLVLWGLIRLVRGRR